MNAPKIDSHPSTVDLDRLRAGLTDHQPDERARLLDHLAACDRCRTLASWEQVTTVLNDATTMPPAIGAALRERRRAALTGRSPRRVPGHAPRLAIAAALAAVLVAVGMFLAFPRPADDPAPVMTRSGTVPDIYADLDFYLWLTRENEKNGDASSTRG